MALRTHQRGPPLSHKGPGRAHPPGARPLPRGPHVDPLHLFLHPHTSSSSRKNPPIAQTHVPAHLVAHFEIPIRHYEKEEKLLPPVFLDYKSMVAHDFIVKNNKKLLKYNLIFDKNYCEFITLPAPSLFNIFSGTYLILPEAIYAYWSLTPAPEAETEPPLDPYR